MTSLSTTPASGPARDRLPRHRQEIATALVTVMVTVLMAACSPGTATPTATPGPALQVPELDSPLEAVQAITSGLQLDLQGVGYNPGPVSGQFDATTERALTDFQVHADVPAAERGALGPVTAQSLAARLSGASEAIRALQSALTDVGLFRGTINGQYGSDTLAAVKALQRLGHQTADGLYGPLTAATLTGLYTRDVPEPGAAPTSTSSTTAAPGPTSSGPGNAPLRLGSTGPRVTQLQESLTALGYRPGPPDGVFGAATASAVLAFQKREGLTRDGVAGPQLLQSLAAPHGAGPRSGLPTPRIEVDIARQIAFVVLPSQPVITLNVSTGNGSTYRAPGGGTDVAYTPVGSFKVQRKIAGDHVAPLGTLHDPIYFYQGWAVHGAASVPAYPASHGCVRISNTDADWLFPLIPVGTVVVLYDTTGKSPGPDGLPPGAAPGY